MGRQRVWAAGWVQGRRRTPVLDERGRAAIVSTAVAGGGPILLTVRGEPVHEAGSGWAFHGDEAIADGASAQVWSLRDVLRREPTLEAYLALSPGTVLERAGEGWSRLMDHPDRP